MFKIIYQDSYCIAIDKTGGMLVHRTRIAEEESDFVLQHLRDQVGRHLYPVHRLDRPTSGVLLFAFDPETARTLSNMLTDSGILNTYTALVRGWYGVPELLHHPVKNYRGNLCHTQT